MTRYKESAFLALFLVVTLASIYVGKAGAIACNRERDEYNGASCAQSAGLGGTDNTSVATPADCMAFCDGSCHTTCGDTGAACSFIYVNCAY